MNTLTKNPYRWAIILVFSGVFAFAQGPPTQSNPGQVQQAPPTPPQQSAGQVDQTGSTMSTSVARIEAALQQQMPAIAKTVAVSMGATGNIDLIGVVATQEEKDQIGQIAQAQTAPGEAIVNNVTVTGSGGTAIPPSAIAQAGQAGVPQSNPNAPAVAQQGYPSANSQNQSGTAISPADLRGQIQAALQQDPALANSNIRVDVTKNTIEFSGTVASRRAKQTAKRIVESYADGRKVVDHTKVSSTGTTNPAVPPRQ